jgi:hypothetical protein
MYISTDHSSCAVYDMNCRCSPERWDRGYESHARHGCVYSVCVVLCEGSDLATGRSPVQGVQLSV